MSGLFDDEVSEESTNDSKDSVTQVVEPCDIVVDNVACKYVVDTDKERFNASIDLKNKVLKVWNGENWEVSSLEFVVNSEEMLGGKNNRYFYFEK